MNRWAIFMASFQDARRAGKLHGMAKSSAKSAAVSALEFLARPDAYPAASVCAVAGDDAYLKSSTLTALRRQVLGGGEGDFSLTTLQGRDAQFRDLIDALASVSLFGGGKRLVIVEEADSFVSQFRSELEDYAARPFRDGVLVLDVKTWPTNTRLAKALAADGLTIDCKTPNERQIKSWLVQRAKVAHEVRLEAAAADALLELLPPELGILEQEVAKLALLVGEKRVIDSQLVYGNVGGWRTRTTWEMIDAAADGRAATALAELDRLISAGEKPHGLLPQMSSSLRRFGAAALQIEAAETDRRRLPLRDALAQAGVPPFKLSDAERQLRRIGRRRAKELTGWLLAADLAIKGHNSSDDRARMELERLIVRLSGPAEAATLAR
jgi:DNA polymerase-3 subunit delta